MQRLRSLYRIGGGQMPVKETKLQWLCVLLKRCAGKNRRCCTRPYCNSLFCQIRVAVNKTVLEGRIHICRTWYFTIVSTRSDGASNVLIASSTSQNSDRALRQGQWGIDSPGWRVRMCATFYYPWKTQPPTVDDAAPCIGRTLYGLREMVSFAMGLLTKQMRVRAFYLSWNSVIIIEVGVLEWLKRSTYTSKQPAYLLLLYKRCFKIRQYLRGSQPDSGTLLFVTSERSTPYPSNWRRQISATLRFIGGWIGPQGYSNQARLNNKEDAQLKFNSDSPGGRLV